MWFSYAFEDGVVEEPEDGRAARLMVALLLREEREPDEEEAR